MLLDFKVTQKKIALLKGENVGLKECLARSQA